MKFIENYSGKQNIKSYDISIVTPVYNEEKNIEEHFSQINSVLSGFNRSFEVIFVNDGSIDGSERILRELHNKQANIVIINLFRKKGKAAALEVGIEYAQGQCVVIIDSDLQYSASDIPQMIKELDNGYDLVSGKRVVRGDPRSIIITSGIFNLIMRKLTGLNFVDYFSGLKCFKRDVINYLSLYGDLYRFAAVYAFKQGFKVKEIPVKHYSRKHGNSKYGSISRFNMAFLDILTVLLTVTINPDRVYYIGLLGSLALSIGTIFLFKALLFSFQQMLFLSRDGLIFGIVLIFLGIQALILKKISKDYFDRHQSERVRRKSNLRNILRHECD